MPTTQTTNRPTAEQIISAVMGISEEAAHEIAVFVATNAAEELNCGDTQFLYNLAMACI